MSQSDKSFQSLPPDLKVPQDYVLAKHLAGVRLPDSGLACDGWFDGRILGDCRDGSSSTCIRERASRESRRSAAGTTIPGARGCTPQAATSAITMPSSSSSAWRGCSGRRPRVPTTSARRSSGCICRSRCCPMRRSKLTRALRATDLRGAGETLLKRMAWVIDEGVIPRRSIRSFRPTRTPKK